MRTNFFTSDLFMNIASGLYMVLSMVVSGCIGYWVALAEGANLTASNPFAGSAVLACSIIPFTLCIIGFTFFIDWLSDWQYNQRNK